MEARRQYGIGFNVVPMGDVIEKGETNVNIVKTKTSVVCLKKKTLYYWLKWFKTQKDTE